jgi:hypothetical protein
MIRVSGSEPVQNPTPITMTTDILSNLQAGHQFIAEVMTSANNALHAPSPEEVEALSAQVDQAFTCARSHIHSALCLLKVEKEAR